MLLILKKAILLLKDMQSINTVFQSQWDGEGSVSGQTTIVWFSQIGRESDHLHSTSI